MKHRLQKLEQTIAALKRQASKLIVGLGAPGGGSSGFEHPQIDFAFSTCSCDLSGTSGPNTCGECITPGSMAPESYLAQFDSGEFYKPWGWNHEDGEPTFVELIGDGCTYTSEALPSDMGDVTWTLEIGSPSVLSATFFDGAVVEYQKYEQWDCLSGNEMRLVRNSSVPQETTQNKFKYPCRLCIQPYLPSPTGCDAVVGAPRLLHATVEWQSGERICESCFEDDSFRMIWDSVNLVWRGQTSENLCDGTDYYLDVRVGCFNQVVTCNGSAGSTISVGLSSSRPVHWTGTISVPASCCGKTGGNTVFGITITE